MTGWWSLAESKKRHRAEHVGKIREDFLEEMVVLNTMGVIKGECLNG